jgi:hypothetical protein
MTTLDVCRLCEQSVDPPDGVAYVCPLCDQPVDLLDDVAYVDDGNVCVPAHLYCPRAV